jgi:hypothetical protein
LTSPRLRSAVRGNIGVARPRMNNHPTPTTLDEAKLRPMSGLFF